LSLTDEASTLIWEYIGEGKDQLMILHMKQACQYENTKGKGRIQLGSYPWSKHLKMKI
jgi:hypothetical protein